MMAARKIAVVLVHYHTPELLQSATEALCMVAEVEGFELEGVVVDNGSRPEDRLSQRARPFRILEPGLNLGYAGGANLGIRETSAELVILMNPDVIVGSGCLTALINTLESGAWAAGPRFYWDEERTYLLPPTETVDRRSALASVLADRSPMFARWARAAWRRHARAHWQAVDDLVSWALSGALLIVRREAWRRVGPMDEGYRLYFEETDWLRRLERCGLEARYVPAAEAVHLYAQSTAREGRAEAWFQASSRRFRKRHYGLAFDALVRHMPGRASVERAINPGQLLAATPISADPSAWLEVSTTPKGFPAAGRNPGRYSPEAQIFPASLERRLMKGSYYLRRVVDSGHESEIEVFERA